VSAEPECDAGAASHAAALAVPPGLDRLPSFDDGWLSETGSRRPYLSYVDSDVSVNWSDELEALHEESSRTHFLDRWTRAAMIARIGCLSRGVRIADVGCSSGHLLEDLRLAYPRAELIGVDLITAGLAKAHVAVPTARLLHADACSLPLADASVDAITSANLLEHITDDRRALAEFARVLRPGGRAVVVVPAGPRTCDYYDRFLGHERRYGRQELASKCAAAGLEPMESVHIASLLYPAFWLVKQRNRLRYRDLDGVELERRVATAIGHTRDSRVGYITWRLEDRLVRSGVRLPFGIRSLVLARRAA
jgi:SAM-dependent methyltransferase